MATESFIRKCDCGHTSQCDCAVAEPITDPAHGGKITCHKCGAFLHEGSAVVIEFGVYFHPHCFNRYEHYYGLDKGID